VYASQERVTEPGPALMCARALDQRGLQWRQQTARLAVVGLVPEDLGCHVAVAASLAGQVVTPVDIYMTFTYCIFHLMLYYYIYLSLALLVYCKTTLLVEDLSCVELPWPSRGKSAQATSHTDIDMLMKTARLLARWRLAERLLLSLLPPSPLDRSGCCELPSCRNEKNVITDNRVGCSMSDGTCVHELKSYYARRSASV